MAERQKMKLVYVAGPYRAASEYEVALNIARARVLAVDLWRAGCEVICPHMNTTFLGGACPDEVWLAGDIEMMLRCDAVCLVPGWKSSKGTVAEVAAAVAAGIPVFESSLELWAWACGEEGGSVKPDAGVALGAAVPLPAGRGSVEADPLPDGRGS